MDNRNQISMRLMNSGADRQLIIEPWAEEFLFQSGTEIVVSGDSTRPGEFTLEIDDSAVVIYGWAGSSVILTANGKVIWRSYPRL